MFKVADIYSQSKRIIWKNLSWNKQGWMGNRIYLDFKAVWKEGRAIKALKSLRIWIEMILVHTWSFSQANILSGFDVEQRGTHWKTIYSIRRKISCAALSLPRDCHQELFEILGNIRLKSCWTCSGNWKCVTLNQLRTRSSD